MLYYDDKSILWVIYAPSWNLMNTNLTITNRRNVSNYPESSITKFRNSLWQLLKKEIPPKKLVKCFWGIRCLLYNQLRRWLIRHQQIHFDPYSLLQIKKKLCTFGRIAILLILRFVNLIRYEIEVAIRKWLDYLLIFIVCMRIDNDKEDIIQALSIPWCYRKIR